MHSYHGTSSSNAPAIAADGVKVTIGGGELGQGFYTGEYLHEAKAWAYQRWGNVKLNVVEFDVPDEQVDQLQYQILDYSQAGVRRNYIRRAGRTRTYRFGCDMVWAPIVGSARANGDQYKWESATAETLLNSGSTAKLVI